MLKHTSVFSHYTLYHNSLPFKDWRGFLMMVIDRPNIQEWINYILYIYIYVCVCVCVCVCVYLHVEVFGFIKWIILHCTVKTILKMRKNLTMFIYIYIYHSTGHLNKSADTLAAVSKLTNSFTHEFDDHVTAHRETFL